MAQRGPWSCYRQYCTGVGYPVRSCGGSVDFVQYTIVTADGSILTANENEHPDLFWAVRGGGSNFGVVTEFVFRLHEQRPKVFAGPVLFSPDKCEKIAEFLDDWWPRAKAEEGMIVVMMRGPDGNVRATMVLCSQCFKLTCFQAPHFDFPVL